MKPTHAREVIDTPADVTALRSAQVRPSWKARLQSFALALVSLTLSLLAAEVICRSVLPPVRTDWPVGLYQSDPNPTISYRLVPNTKGSATIAGSRYPISINSLGFRGPEPRLQPGTQCIGVFGDSFSFGVGVENHETFPALLQQSLGSDGYCVLNTAVSGQSPAQEHAIYQELSLRRRIDTVIIQLCDNDVIDQAAPSVRRVHNRQLYSVVPKTPREKLYVWLVTNSELLAQIFFLLKFRNRETAMQPVLNARFEQVNQRAIDSTKRLLTTWFDQAHAAGQRVCVLYVPRKQQVDPGWAPALDKLREGGDPVDVDAGHRWLVRFLAGHPDVKYLDIVAAFRESYSSGGPPLYFSRDGHTNAAGHRIIANNLARWLRGGRTVRAGAQQ